ncbi:MAG: hypothetical protein AAGE01_13685 [Pseudomonadota bacterium]
MIDDDAFDSAAGFAVEETLAAAGARQVTESARDGAPPGGSIVLFPTNGVGFGHFTRQYAIARRLKRLLPETEVVFFTMMPVLHVPYDEGFKTYHISGRRKHGRDLSVEAWNRLLAGYLSLILDQYQPWCFIFDGAFAYGGMLESIRNRPETRKIWMRRALSKRPQALPDACIECFDEIVQPDDALLTAGAATGIEVTSCPPIVVLDRDEMLSRESARKRLGIAPDAKAVYVQLGAGRINDIHSEIRLTIEALLKHPEVTVVLGESMLGSRLNITLDRVISLRDYPNLLYYNAFDAVVQAGGYNAFHETRACGLPALFYPNMRTSVDDQLARCRVAEVEGWGRVVAERSAGPIDRAIEWLLSMEKQAPEHRLNGATVMAQRLARLCAAVTDR